MENFIQNYKQTLQKIDIIQKDSIDSKPEDKKITCTLNSDCGEAEIFFYFSRMYYTNPSNTKEYHLIRLKDPKSDKNPKKDKNDICELFKKILSGNNKLFWVICPVGYSEKKKATLSWFEDFIIFCELFDTNNNQDTNITFLDEKLESIKEMSSDVRIFEKDNFKLIFVKNDVKTLTNYLLSCDNRVYKKRVISTIDYIPVEKTKEIFKMTEGFKHNLIVNGAPGTGKSHYIKKRIEEYFDIIRNEAKINNSDGQQPEVLDATIERDIKQFVTRVTFYEDYSYENFVGCYKPVPTIDEKEISFGDTAGTIKGGRIDYRFEPGPFIQTYIKAKKEPEIAHFLVIEEINRAKAATVFGDVFQLLDRKSDGTSEYEITPEPALDNYLREQLGDSYSGTMSIPSNMFIWATMNSADQGVYPLDSAFKRRWSFMYMDINQKRESKDKDKEIITYIHLKTKGAKGEKGEKKKILWDSFRQAINAVILANGYDEDRCIGAWYFSDDELSEINDYPNNENEDKKNLSNPFVDKLLMYLRQDVFRMNPTEIFKEGYTSMSMLRNNFAQANIEDIFKDGIFDDKKIKWEEISSADSDLDSSTANEADTAKAIGG